MLRWNACGRGRLGLVQRYLSTSTESPVLFEDISRAYFRIKSGIIRTPCKRSLFLSEICGMDVYTKKDLQQYSGSFKERGARNALMQLTPEEKERGVIAASAGNHALALALHGKDLGIPVTVVMPTVAPLTKINNCRKFGANVIIHGGHIGEAKEFATSNHSDMRYINGYDDPEIIAGAGTMGIEILEQVPDVEAVVVPVGGGGLIAGVSLAMKTLRREAKVYGVEPVTVASFTAAQEAGYPVHEMTAGTLADGLAVPVVGTNAFTVANKYVDEVGLVTEKQILLGVLRCVEAEKTVVEGGGAAGLAGILPGGPFHEILQGKKVVVPLCGGNIDTTVLGRVIDRGLAADRRLIRFTVTVSDRPGGIAGLSAMLAAEGVSIKDIHHERAWCSSQLDQVQVKCVVETTDSDHADRCLAALTATYPVEVHDIL